MFFVLYQINLLKGINHKNSNNGTYTSYLRISVAVNVVLDFPYNEETSSLSVPQPLHHFPPSVHIFLSNTQHRPMHSDVVRALF